MIAGSSGGSGSNHPFEKNHLKAKAPTRNAAKATIRCWYIGWRGCIKPRSGSPIQLQYAWLQVTAETEPVRIKA